MKTFAPLDTILSAAVKERRVDYSVVEKNIAALDAFLADVAKASVKELSADEKLAFYVNAYNALVLRAFIAKGKKPVLDTPGFFDKITYLVAGETLTLNTLEERHVRRLDPRGVSIDPRIHFVVNCASKDCPPLAPRAYTGATMQKSLEEQTRAYLSRPGECVVDVAGKRVVVVQLFEWYTSDWGGEGAARKFIAKYAAADVAAKVIDPAWDLDFRRYDWSPNAL
jgi:hypothetical protein